MIPIQGQFQDKYLFCLQEPLFTEMHLSLSIAVVFISVVLPVWAESNGRMKVFVVDTENLKALVDDQAKIIAEHEATIENLNRTTEVLSENVDHQDQQILNLKNRQQESIQALTASGGETKTNVK